MSKDAGEKEECEKMINDLLGMIRYIQSYSGMTKIVSLASTLFHEANFEQKLDSIPYLLGVRNGVIDLRLGTLRPRKPDDNIFRIINVDYDPCASTDLFNNIITSVMADDPEMTTFLKKALGYAITGEVSEEIFLVFTAGGRNGKGMITQTLFRLMGAFYKEMHCGLIVDRDVGNIDAERASLSGARIVVFNELNPGEKLKVNELQLLSGGDIIPATPKYKDPISIIPRHTCILTTNHMPELHGEVTQAIVDRLLCVHFPVTFTIMGEGEEPSKFRRPRDDTLKERILADLQGVLRWLVEGAVMWYGSKDLKRNAPEAVKEFSKQYFRDQDVLAAFITEMCVVGEGEKVGSSDFLMSYNNWTEDKKLDNKAMASFMRSKGFEKKRCRFNGDNIQCFLGIALKKDVNDDLP
jgi:putative DNA primase/helicase